ncbi:MAG: YgfZ/GcvT domain-containing protein [Acidimicrobiales bacterium]
MTPPASRHEPASLGADVPFRDRPAAAWWDRDVIEMSGPDATSFLQGQLSQDVEALTDQRGAWSFLLEPQGKLAALLQIARGPDETYLLHTDAGFGEAVVERIERFRLRVKAELRLLDWRVLIIGGPGTAELVGAALQTYSIDLPGVEGCVQVIGPNPALPTDVPLVESVWFEALRIEAGVPRLGVDVEVGAIPAESGLVDLAASFTKGCYTGQELVARIDSRGGRTPRRLAGVIDGPQSAMPCPLFHDGDEVGVLTSISAPETRPSPIGLATVRRAVEPDAEVRVGTPDGGVARIAALPLVS